MTAISAPSSTGQSAADSHPDVRQTRLCEPTNGSGKHYVKDRALRLARTMRPRTSRRQYLEFTVPPHPLGKVVCMFSGYFRAPSSRVQICPTAPAPQYPINIRSPFPASNRFILLSARFFFLPRAYRFLPHGRWAESIEYCRGLPWRKSALPIVIE